MFKRILVICIGNICRSPTAEYLFRQQLAGRDIQVGSAGLGALAGKPMDPTALRLLQERGIDASGHVARQVETQLLRDADLVLVMERRHAAAVHRFAPEAGGKVFLLDKWVGGSGIRDPYRKAPEAFEHAYSLIERGVASWLRYL